MTAWKSSKVWLFRGRNDSGNCPLRPPILAETGAGRKNQRLNDDRHRARSVEDGADVDVVELLEFEAVDRDDRIFDLQLLAVMDADQSADVAVAGKHDGMAAGEHGLQSVGNTLAEIIKPPERRRAAPCDEDG